MSSVRSNYIILINYNNYSDTIECLESIQNQTYDHCVPIVVDNASSNESVSEIKKRFPDLLIVENEENVGFSGANNIGAQIALAKGAEIITFLNNDMVLPENFFEILLKGIEDNQCICPLMLYYDNHDIINYSGGFFDYKKGAGTTPERGKRINPNTLFRREVTLAHGGCSAMTAKTYQLLGPWKTEYFLYREDDEYSARMLSKGVKIIFEPAAVLYHKESVTTGGDAGLEFRNYYLTRNKLYNIKEYKLGRIVELRAILGALLSHCRYVLCKDRRYKNCWKGVKDYLRGISGKVNL